MVVCSNCGEEGIGSFCQICGNPYSVSQQYPPQTFDREYSSNRQRPPKPKVRRMHAKLFIVIVIVFLIIVATFGILRTMERTLEITVKSTSGVHKIGLQLHSGPPGTSPESFDVYSFEGFVTNESSYVETSDIQIYLSREWIVMLFTDEEFREEKQVVLTENRKVFVDFIV